MKQLLTIILVACLSLTAGCNKKSGTADLRKFTENAYKNRKPQVEPLPPLKPASVFIYTASGEKDPFNRGNLRIQKPRNEDTGGGEEGPDLTRKREPLEAYPFDALKLVGVMEQNGITWAVINAPDKTVHRVTEGNYAGRNHGEIKRIAGNRVQVEELVRNPVGKWQKRNVKLVLVE